MKLQNRSGGGPLKLPHAFQKTGKRRGEGQFKDQKIIKNRENPMIRHKDLTKQDHKRLYQWVAKEEHT